MLGRVIRCKNDKDYAFILGSDKNTYFCHFSNVDDGTLEVGYMVDFRVSYNKQNDSVSAKDVKVVDSWYRSCK